MVGMDESHFGEEVASVDMRSESITPCDRIVDEWAVEVE